MQQYSYASLENIDNVLAQLPPEAKGPQTNTVVFPQENGTFILQVEDQYAAAVATANPYTPGQPALQDYAGAKRWETETAGIMVTVDQPRPISTTIDSQSKIADLNASFVNGTNTGTVSFKCADGTFFDADDAAINTIYVAVMNHVQACYAAEEQAHAGIAAHTITTQGGVDACFGAIETLPQKARQPLLGRR